MRKKVVFFLSVLIFGANPAFAFAQTISPSVPPSPSPALTGTMTRSEAKDAMKEAREEFKTARSAARDAFKTKLATIKDLKKQAMLTNFDGKIAEINKKRTDHMSQHLEKLTNVLTKISTRAAALKSQGKNTALVEADITAAQAAIDAAKLAVSEQAAKDYLVTIVNPNNLKNPASTVMRQFITDLKAVFQKVLAAKTAVRKAHTDMAKLMGNKPSTVPSPSTTAAPTTSVTVSPSPSITSTP